MRVFPDTRDSSTDVSAERAETREMTLIMRALPWKAIILGLVWPALAAAEVSAPPQSAPESPAVTTFAPPGSSPSSPPGAPAPTAATGRDAPSAETAVATYLAARRWLDAAGRGEPVPTPADVHAAAVVLRVRGRTVGIGKALAEGRTPAPVDAALRAALEDAFSRRAVKGAERAAEFPRTVTLELELAGPRQPLIGRTFEEVARSLEPGECGLVMADGSRTAYEPASVLLARRMASPVSRAVLSLVTDLGLPPRDLPELQELGGATAIYASRSIRIAQGAPDAMPFVLARAVPALQSEPARAGEAARLAAGVIARLSAQLQPPSPAEGLPDDAAAQIARTGLRGDYAIAADRYEPFAAGPAEQALCAWALARASTVASWPAPVRAQARDAALRVLAALQDTDPTERPTAAEPAAVAYALLAAADLGSDAHDRLAAQLVPTLASLATPAALASVRPHVRAAVLDAAAARAAAGAVLLERAALERLLDETLAETPAAELPLVAPIVFDALRRLHGDAWAAAAAPHRDRLEAARTVLLATQVRPDDGTRPASLADMVGAYPMAGSAAGRISAQSLRSQLFVAMLAGQPAWRAPMRDGEDRASLRWAVRFVAQLAAPGSIAYCAPTPERAVGGILASPADAAQPVAAQAVAILALAESEAALERLSAPVPGQSGPNP
jgi:hypothetical protein